MGILQVYASRAVFILMLIACIVCSGFGQTNLLLNGNFEDINTCKEFNAECGVEGWFYLKDVKVQMVNNEPGTKGANSFAIFYNWNGYKDFTPVIGTILPCRLQAGKQYIFKGWITARLHSQLVLTPAVCTGESFYVPRRPFSKSMSPQPIMKLKPVAETSFYEFEYMFTANGSEQYLAFGTYITEDTIHNRKRLFGAQTVSLMLDNFSLTATDPNETLCAAYTLNKQAIYQYDYRHKEMDYTLYGKGKLPVELSDNKEDNLTAIKAPPTPSATIVKPDTLKLGDVLFDFNKAALKPTAIKMLQDFFNNKNDTRSIDSVYIEGHTDSIGSDKRNIQMSEERSKSIQEWMVTHHLVADDNITIRAFGRARPAATNKTPAGRALNRRVEIIVFRSEGANRR